MNKIWIIGDARMDGNQISKIHKAKNTWIRVTIELICMQAADNHRSNDDYLFAAFSY